MSLHRILHSPYTTEKTNLMKDDENKVVFKVAQNTSKSEIKKAAEKIFSVKVEKVAVLNKRGKKKKLGRNEGRKADWKKAILTLKKGDKINIFEGA